MALRKIGQASAQEESFACYVRYSDFITVKKMFWTLGSICGSDDEFGGKQFWSQVLLCNTHEVSIGRYFPKYRKAT